MFYLFQRGEKGSIVLLGPDDGEAQGTILLRVRKGFTVTLQGELEGEAYKMVVDTGAAVTVVRLDMGEKLKECHTQTALQAATGSPIHVKAVAEASIKISKNCKLGEVVARVQRGLPPGEAELEGCGKEERAYAAMFRSLELADGLGLGESRCLSSSTTWGILEKLELPSLCDVTIIESECTVK